jgi:hypothetical protein
MDRNQVRSRIIEVAHAVKKALVERGIASEEKDSGYKRGGKAGQRRNSPFWSEEAGYKYIDDVEAHLSRLFQCFDLLDPRPGSSVFEIGPGNCYFLVMCRDLRRCRVAGVDWKQDDTPGNKKAILLPYHDLKKYAFRLFREHFGLEEAVRHQVVQGNQPVTFGGSYDAIVATRAMFNHGWGEGEYRYWLRDCYRHLEPEGKLLVHFNKVDPEHLADLPFLRPAQVPSSNEKLSLIGRIEIGRVLGEQG